jgi:hypothetical protein
MKDITTKVWIASFVALVFVCGLSIGIAVSAWLGPRAGMVGFRGPFPPGGARMTRPAFISERIVERLGNDPNFTEEQRERLEALFAERENLFRQFNLEMRERFETEQSSLHADIAAILTPAQMEIFDAARRSGRRRRGGMRDRER